MGVNMNVWEISGHAIHRHVIAHFWVSKIQLATLDAFM